MKSGKKSTVENDLQQIKYLLSRLIGTETLSDEAKFSDKALNKATKAFQDLSLARGEWVAEDDIPKYIKTAGWRSGKLIREQFAFRRCFKRGHTFYFYKADLIELAEELKKRNIDVTRYGEYIADQEKFRNLVNTAMDVGKGKSAKKGFKLPTGLKDITTSPAKYPPVETIREHIQQLKSEFFANKYADYIDLYKNTHAMMKFIYHYEKYLEPGLKRSMIKWCEAFNSANTLLKEITGKKEKLLPIREEELIRL